MLRSLSRTCSRFLGTPGLVAGLACSLSIAVAADPPSEPPSSSNNTAAHALLPGSEAIEPQRLFEVDQYSEGVVFDSQGTGFISHGPKVTRFTIDGQHETWVTLKGPNGHKVRPDGNHIVCDPGRKAMLLLNPEGKELAVLSDSCDGRPLRGPNDITLDQATGGFYFTDPGGSSVEKPIGTIHYVDRSGKTLLVASGLAFPNGIVLLPGGKTLLVAESHHNRILSYPVTLPGHVGQQTVFADLPKKAEGQIDNQPDGICLDAAGNLYVAHYGMGQVQVLNPQGKLLQRYSTGLLLTSNVAFGGPQFDTLYITGAVGGAGTPGGVAVLKLKTAGLRLLGQEN